MHKIKNFLATIIMAVSVVAGFGMVATPTYALFENAKNEAQCGANLTDSTLSSCADATGSEAKFGTTLKAVLNILSIVAGVIAVIMIIIAGIRFVTSQGDGNSAASARNTLIYAVVGVVIIAVAQFIVFVVVGRV